MIINPYKHVEAILKGVESEKNSRLLEDILKVRLSHFKPLGGVDIQVNNGFHNF